MSWITVVWSMDAAVCFTLAGIYLLVWCKQREGWVHLLFSCSAVAAGVIAGFELASMRAETTTQFGALMRWAHLPVWMLIVSVVWFVRLYLRAGRPWLAWSVCGLRTLALVLNFVFTPNVNYREITSLRHLSWWGGETVSAPVGVPSTWTLVGELGLLLLIIFFVDATITVWRRGDRGRALVVGGSAIAFTTLALGQSALVIWGAIESPFFVSFPYLGIIAAMGYELSSDVLRAAQLARQLQASEADMRETEQRMELAASAADLGMWVWDIERDEVWLTDKRRALYGFAPSEKLDVERLQNLVHPEDRESVRVAVDNALNTGAEYDTEYRIVLPDGQVRWMAGRGRVEFNREGKPARMRGVSLDITERWRAEQELQQLRQEIAHVSRVSMMGQLASALAHEINQPLGAILRNAEAAELFIRHESPDLNEIRAILADIRKDDQRASAVISRMRALLKGHEPRHASNRGRRTHRRSRSSRSRGCGGAAREARNECIARITLGEGRPRASAASAAQSHPQWNGRAQRNHTERSSRDCLRAARRCSIHRDCRQRYRFGHSCGRTRARLRAVLYNQAPGHGYGAADLAHDYRSARRAPLGREQQRRRGNVPLHAASCKGGWRDMSTAVPIVHIVDDDASFLAATSRLLRASGFAVKTFPSASEFLAQRDVEAAGCAVVDLQMPGLNGLDLQSALGRTRNPLPVIFLTGQGDIPTSVRAMREGAEDFLNQDRAESGTAPCYPARACARCARTRGARATTRDMRAIREADGARARSSRAYSSRTLEQTDRRRSRHP